MLNTFQLAWLVGGWIIGYLSPELLKLSSNIGRIPWMFRAGCGFVGALTAYTLTR